MHPLSEEQQHILELVMEGKNVVVDAVAGTGKTTLVLGIAAALKNKKILQVTYNAALRKDVQQRVGEEELTNLQVHTYHSLAKQHYLDVGYTDKEIRKALMNHVEPHNKIREIDVLVVDECQDMTHLYFQLLLKYLYDMNKKVQLIVLGDYKQGLYEFKGADTRFLTMAKEFWKKSGFLRTPDIELVTMKMSFRITNQIREFVNNVMLGEPRMNACREGMKVFYVRRDPRNMLNIVHYQIKRLLQEGAFPSDFFILASSIKATSMNVCKLENMLVEMGLPCHVPIMKDEKLDERVIDGKIVFSTFHSSKGRQRKYVFVVGFDNNYFRFFDRKANPEECPNTLYVAATRATEGLFVLEGQDDEYSRPLDFLQLDHFAMKKQDYIDFKGHPQAAFLVKDDDDSKQDVRNVTATELTKFISEEVMDIISPMIDSMFVREETGFDEIDIPTVFQTKNGLYEEVSDLNGIAIPSMYYDYLNEMHGGKNEGRSIKQGQLLLNRIMEDMQEKKHVPELLRKIIVDLPSEITTIEDYLYICNVSIALNENLLFKLRQIERDEYTWLDGAMVTSCKQRLNEVLKEELSDYAPQAEVAIVNNDMIKVNAKIDEILQEHLPEYDRKIRFGVRVDLITQSTLWELKCTTETVIEHYVQLVLYAWLWRLRYEDGDDDDEKNKQFRLFNIKTGEIFRLDATTEEMGNVVIEILKGKYIETLPKSDDEFLEKCMNEVEQYNMKCEDVSTMSQDMTTLFSMIE